jgi:hypothetical protein
VLRDRIGRRTSARPRWPHPENSRSAH